MRPGGRVRGFREIAERLAGPDARVHVKVWLAGGVVEGVLEFVDGPLWVIADRGARTWIDEQAVHAVTVADASRVTDAIAEGVASEIPSPSSLRTRLEEVAERFDCKVAGDLPTADDARVALGRLLVDLEVAMRRVIATRGDAFLDDGLRVELGEPGVDRGADGALRVTYRPGPRGRLDVEKLAAAIEKVD